ncbi:MAG: transketolase [Clostridiales bacterium]|jgi:transketolase|nr:transketolase [Clostridiales bacterium]
MPLDSDEARASACKVSELRRKAYFIRKRLLRMIYRAGTGHTGGSLSSADILTALYYHVLRIRPEEPGWPGRDRFLLSKGHSVEGLYCVLADLGFFDERLLDSFSAFGSPLIGHPNNKVPGIELNTGALGHGLSIGTGMALAAKRDGSQARVFVLMGDGEQAEGSVWEAAMAAAHYGLDGLYAIIDCNGLQISGRTEHVMALGSLESKWGAFGWQVFSCDGHDMASILGAFERMQAEAGRPKLLIARTVKGRGVSYMENAAKWHHGVPAAEQYEQAISELDAAMGDDARGEGLR